VTNVLLNSFFDDRKTVQYMKSSGKTKKNYKKTNDRSRVPTIEEL